MGWGLWVSIFLGVGVAGHAVVGIVLTTLAGPTERLWRPFGTRKSLLRLNGVLLATASGLHLVVSYAKVMDATGALFWSSIAPFAPFMFAGLLETRHVTWVHHMFMAAGWAAFAWHGSI